MRELDVADPTLPTFTVMKNKGPFIIEWVAWQRLMGVGSIVMLNWRETAYDFLSDVVDLLTNPSPDRSLIAPAQHPKNGVGAGVSNQ